MAHRRVSLLLCFVPCANRCVTDQRGNVRLREGALTDDLVQRLALELDLAAVGIERLREQTGVSPVADVGIVPCPLWI